MSYEQLLLTTHKQINPLQVITRTIDTQYSEYGRVKILMLHKCDTQ